MKKEIFRTVLVFKISQRRYFKRVIPDSLCCPVFLETPCMMEVQVFWICLETFLFLEIFLYLETFLYLEIFLCLETFLFQKTLFSLGIFYE